MQPGLWNPTLLQGADFDYTITWLVDDSESADPVDLTGWTARMKVKDKGDLGAALASIDPWLEITSGDGITLGGVAGTIRLFVSASDTAMLGKPVSKLLYDLELVDGSTVVRLLEGEMTFSPEVTN
jgi:hypothetical protein